MLDMHELMQCNNHSRLALIDAISQTATAGDACDHMSRHFSRLLPSTDARLRAAENLGSMVYRECLSNQKTRRVNMLCHVGDGHKQCCKQHNWFGSCESFGDSGCACTFQV